MEAKTSHHVIHISTKFCHYSHSTAGEYTREASRRNFFTFELHIDEEVDDDNKLYKWYERSTGRMVHGTKLVYT